MGEFESLLHIGRGFAQAVADSGEEFGVIAMFGGERFGGFGGIVGGDEEGVFGEVGFEDAEGADEFDPGEVVDLGEHGVDVAPCSDDHDARHRSICGVPKNLANPDAACGV